MDSTNDLPAGWSIETERTTHDTVMGRAYTTVVYRQTPSRHAVYINEVIDGENVWRYDVHLSGPDGAHGTADDLETAKRLAVAFITDSDTTA